VAPAFAKYAEHYFHASLNSIMQSSGRMPVFIKRREKRVEPSIKPEQILFAAEDSEFAIMNWSSTP